MGACSVQSLLFCEYYLKYRCASGRSAVAQYYADADARLDLGAFLIAPILGLFFVLYAKCFLAILN